MAPLKGTGHVLLGVLLMMLLAVVMVVEGQQYPSGVHLFAEEVCYPPYCATTRLFSNNKPYNTFAQLELPENPAAYNSAVEGGRRRKASMGVGEFVGVGEFNNGWNEDETKEKAEEEAHLRRICKNLKDTASEEMRLSCRRFLELEEKVEGEQQEEGEEGEQIEKRKTGIVSGSSFGGDAGGSEWESQVWKTATKIFGRNKKTDFLFQAQEELKKRHQQVLFRQEEEHRKQMELQAQQKLAEESAQMEMFEKMKEDALKKTLLLQQNKAAKDEDEEEDDSLLVGRPHRPTTTRNVQQERRKRQEEEPEIESGNEERCTDCVSPSQSSSVSPSPSLSSSRSSSPSPTQPPSISQSPSASPSTSPSPSPSPIYPIGFNYPDDIQGPAMGDKTFVTVTTDRADNAIELLSFNWTHDQGLGMSFSSVGGAYFRSDSFFESIEGHPGNFPITIRKYIDETSPIWFQATTDFDPFGNSYTYGNNTEGNGTRTCPRLFQMLVSIPLDSVMGATYKMMVLILDAIPTNIKISVPSDGSRPVETIDFMWRAMVGGMVNGNYNPVGGQWQNLKGYGVGGIPPVPIPSAPSDAPFATDCCGKMIPWSPLPLVEQPYCGYYSIPAYSPP